VTREARASEIKSKCLSCHTNDQSPEWYGKEGSKVVNEKVFAGKFRKMSCPLNP